MRTHLTPFQLFFATFLYVFSGISLSGADSLFALLLPFAAAALWCCIGYGGANRKRHDFSDFLSAYLPRKESGIPLTFFLFVTAAEAVLSLLDLSLFFHRESDFVPFALILAVLIGIAFLISRGGMTVLGRISETMLFLLVPAVAIHLFADWEPMELLSHASNLRLAFSVLPTPIWFLLAMTAVSGDRDTSDGFRATANPPKNRALFLTLTAIGGAASAALLQAFFVMFPLGKEDLLVYFLEYSAHAVKLALLFSVLTNGLIGQKQACKILPTVFMGIAAVLTLAIAGGAVFSPFLWMMLLVCLSITVAGLLGIFSLFSERKSSED